jgi:hypothetical protein
MGNKSSTESPPLAAVTAIVYATTHGQYVVPTTKDIEIDSVGLSNVIEIPYDMKFSKYNLIPVGICNYTAGISIPDKIHEYIFHNLNPHLLMARYGFKYLQSGDPSINTILEQNHGLRTMLENCHTFRSVPTKYYDLLIDITEKNLGRNLETILDETINGEDNTIIIDIIDEIVKPLSEQIKENIEEILSEYEKEYQKLRNTDPVLGPYDDAVRKRTILESDEMFKKAVKTFNNKPNIDNLLGNIEDATNYINHANDLKDSNWNVSVPNKGNRYIFNKSYSLDATEDTAGLDWNITYYNPKTGEITDLFTSLKEENKTPGKKRTLTLHDIITHLNEIGIKNVLFIDQTCSVFKDLSSENNTIYMANRVQSRKWTNTIKKLVARQDVNVIYGGKKREKRKNHIVKTRKYKIY